MKILLINPVIREWAKPNVLPLGLAYIAATMREAGHEISVMDINTNRWDTQQVEELIKDADFDMVGIGAIITVYKYVKWLTQVIRKHHPEKKIVVGGSVGTSIPEIMLEKTETDIVCIGEGEVTAVEIANAVSSGSSLADIDGIWYKDNKGEIKTTKPKSPIADINAIPMPAWDLFDMKVYLENPIGAINRNKWIDGSGEGDAVELSMNLSATRGCPYKCIYCYHDFMGQKYRNRSAESIVAEMRELYDSYGVTYFHFIDDEFCLFKPFVFEFCAKVKAEFGNTVTWGCSGRVNLMSEQMIEEMVDAGCIVIAYGIESGSQRMLDVMKKKVTVQQAKDAIRLTVKHLGWADCTFMIGTPGENKETITETVDFCKEMGLAPEAIFFSTPYPGTELYRLALEKGKIKDEESYILDLGEQGEQIMVNLTELSDDELYKTQTWMIKELKAWNKLKHPES